MVGVGGRSHVKRCNTCRKRKVKCDGESPACRRCIDHGLLCPGYARKLEFVFSTFNSETAARQHVPSPTKNSTQPQKTSNLTPSSGSKKQSSKTSDLVHAQYDNGAVNTSYPSLTAFQNQVGLMAVLRERYVPELPKFSSEWGDMNGANWIATACALSSDSKYSEMLTDSLMAMSLSLVSNEKDDNQYSTASLKQYSLALNKLRSTLSPGTTALNRHQIDLSLITCLACGMYEMMTNKSLSALIHHLNGVAAILRASGVQALQSAASRRTFYEYRSIYLPIALGIRQPNFLSSAQWISPPWRRSEPMSSSKLHTAIDISFLIPPLMQKFDMLKQLPAASTEKASRTNVLLLDALDIQASLDKWEFRVRDGDDLAALYIPRLANSMAMSKADEHGIYSVSYDFSNWDNASGLSYHSMMQIYINTLIIDIVNFAHDVPDAVPACTSIDAKELGQKSIESADRICQSIEWFLEGHKTLIGRMVILAPFETAKSLFLRICQEGTGEPATDAAMKQKLAFCEGVTRHIQSTGLPVWEE